MFYKVEIKLDSILVGVDAESEEEAREKAYVEFYHEMGGGLFEITETKIVEE